MKTKKKSLMARLPFLCCFLGLLSCGSDSPSGDNGGGNGDVVESTKTTAYYSINDLFPNPERGFYKYSDSEATPSLSEQTLRNYRKDNVTLLYRMYYLKDFKSSALSDAYLAQIDADMATVRKAGLKVILRFAYSSEESEADAPLSIILQHLGQLKSTLQKNADVIALMQAGFIGSWGEWYYTTNGLNTDAARKQVLDKILEVLPESRTVQVRTPNYKRVYVGSKDAMTEADAYTGKAISRIGHHNDCFMASATDYGTYTDATVDKSYLHNEGLYVPMGGETCPPDGVDPADCAKAQSEMRNLRWSYLNADYYGGVLDKWVTGGCMEDIIREMGYRIVLQTGEYTDAVAPGSALHAKISLQNIGYAPPFNPRNVELILQSGDKKKTYTATLTDDPRTWKPYKPITIDAQVMLPSNIVEGDYNLYLFLPDPESAIHDRSEYAIRVANQNCWDDTTGYNNLGMSIHVSKSAAASSSQSSIKFSLKN